MNRAVGGRNGAAGMPGGPEKRLEAMKTESLLARSFVGFALLLLATVVAPSGRTEAQQQPHVTNAVRTALEEEVANASRRLKELLDDLPRRMEEAKHSEENGRKLFDQLEAAIDDIASRLAENSALWKQLGELQQQWQNNHKDALKKAEANSVFRAVADGWKDRLDKVAALKQKILEQRGESLSLMDSLKARREVIVAFYQLGAADKVVASFQEVSAQLQRMNDGMRAIVEATEATIGPVTQ